MLHRVNYTGKWVVKLIVAEIYELQHDRKCGLLFFMVNYMIHGCKQHIENPKDLLFMAVMNLSKKKIKLLDIAISQRVSPLSITSTIIDICSYTLHVCICFFNLKCVLSHF